VAAFAQTLANWLIVQQRYYHVTMGRFNGAIHHREVTIKISGSKDIGVRPRHPGSEVEQITSGYTQRRPADSSQRSTV
jgi:hypothetical protein